MKVYRIMNIKEYELYKAGDLEKLGGYFYGQTLPNNHRYKQDVKYLHFFKNKHAIDRYFRSIEFTKDNNYVLGTFNIPFNKLVLHCAQGKYMPAGFDCDYEVELEFAVPVESLKPEYLIDCEPIKQYSKSDNEMDK